MFSVIENNYSETGHRLVNTMFESGRGSITQGFVRTPFCLVEAYVVYSDTPYGYLCTNYRGRYYQVNFDDAPTNKALVRRAHAMMRQIENESE